MTDSLCPCDVSALRTKGKGQCAVSADLRYNRANETAAEEPPGTSVAIGRRQ